MSVNSALSKTVIPSRRNCNWGRCSSECHQCNPHVTTSYKLSTESTLSTCFWRRQMARSKQDKSSRHLPKRMNWMLFFFFEYSFSCLLLSVSWDFCWLTATTTVTSTPRSPDVTAPTCFAPLVATTLLGFWTVVTPVSSMFQISHASKWCRSRTSVSFLKKALTLNTGCLRSANRDIIIALQKSTEPVSPSHLLRFPIFKNGLAEHQSTFEGQLAYSGWRQTEINE